MAAPVHDVEAISGQGYVRYLHKGSTGKFRTNEIRAGGKSPQPELFAGFPHYSARRIPLSIRVRCLVGFVRCLVGFARGSGVGVRRKCADVRRADAVNPINGATRGADIGLLGDVSILLSHHGRGQHGCGDQPSRQNFKSGHSSFSIGYGSQNILASPLEMSGATGSLN